MQQRERNVGAARNTEGKIWASEAAASGRDMCCKRGFLKGPLVVAEAGVRLMLWPHWGCRPLSQEYDQFQGFQSEAKR